LARVNRYQRYQGNSYQRPRNTGPSHVLRIIAIILFILLLLLAVSILFLQDYLVYSDSGIRLELPWLTEAEEQTAPPPSSSSLIIDKAPTSLPN